jgi:hypothetical protein
MDRRTKDLTGKTFDLLTAVTATSDRSARGNVVWLCRCACGTEVRRETSELLRAQRGVRGIPKSCGCAKRGLRSHFYNGVGDLSGTKWRNIRSGMQPRAGRRFLRLLKGAASTPRIL